MANPKIKDVKGNEVRVQLSGDRHCIDFYLGPEKVRTVRHSKPVKIKWWTAHRIFDQANFKKLATRINQLVPKLK